MSDPSAEAALEYERRLQSEQYTYYLEEKNNLSTALNRVTTANCKLSQIILELADHIYNRKEISETTKSFLSKYYVNLD